MDGMFILLLPASLKAGFKQPALALQEIYTYTQEVL